MKLSINGQEYEFENGKNALDIAGEISKDLKKTALAARINGQVISLPEAINERRRAGNSGPSATQTAARSCATPPAMCWPRRSRSCAPR